MENIAIDKEVLNGGVSLLKAAVTLIPGIGGVANSIISDIQTYHLERKMKRLDDFCEKFDTGLLSIEKVLNEKYISQDDFLDVFEKTAKYVINERSQLKRNIFRNILLNSMKNKKIDYDETERYQKLVDNMDELDFTLLNIFGKSDFFIEKYAYNEIISSEYEVNLLSVVSRLNPLYNVKNDIKTTARFFERCLSYNHKTILDSLYFLQNNRMIIINEVEALTRDVPMPSINKTINNSQSNIYNIAPDYLAMYQDIEEVSGIIKRKRVSYQPAKAFIENRITEKGKDFINFITFA